MNNDVQRRWCFLFPGQGSQRVGMGRDLYVQRPDLVAEIFETADELLGFPLSEIAWTGPEDRLRRTEITQPAIFVASYAAYRVLTERMPEPVAVAGHSLGEYTALVAAGVLEWTDALRLVRHRGELMAAVNETTPGTMAVALGLTASVVERLCAEASAASGVVVEVANYNEPTQTVVSGRTEAVAEFLRRATAELPPDGKIMKIGVGAPFHCSLMAPVEEKFATELATVDFRDPRIPVVANATGGFVTTGTEARDSLRRQLAGPVRWTDSLTTLVDSGVTTFAEVGPGRVLTGICRRTYPDLDCHSASDARRIAALLDASVLPRTV
ncbi:ACP S-malonyltransferase [Micromonospora sp. NPDC049204]|uniref:ACP S-malonyltransferase n=1 Tax=unclassified Micromonospora TaxID=2617518 RepID=UPI0033FEEBB1